MNTTAPRMHIGAGSPVRALCGVVPPHQFVWPGDALEATCPVCLSILIDRCQMRTQELFDQALARGETPGDWMQP